MRNDVPLDVHQISARRDRSALLAEVGATVMLALPLVAGQLAVIGQHVVGIVMACHLGPVVLGAVSVCANAWSLPLMALVRPVNARQHIVSPNPGVWQPE